MSSTWLVSIAVAVCAVACSKKPTPYKSNVASIKIENRTITATESGKPYTGTVIARDREIADVARGVLSPALLEHVDRMDPTGLVLLLKVENGKANGQAELLVDLNAPKLNAEVARRSVTSLEIGRAVSPTIKVADATWKAGTLDGTVTLYSPNEKGEISKTAEVQIANDVVEGTARELHDNGKIARAAAYAGGVLHGEVKAFYANGAKRAHGSYDHGKPIGTHERWYPSGKTQRSVEYADGAVVRSADFYSNGVSRDSPPSGTIEEFYASGAVHSRTEYEAGVKHGREQEWWKNGKPALDATYDHGVRTGTYKRWYASGKEWESSRFVAGTLDGPYRKQWKNGKPAHVYTYKQGKLDGDYRTFYDTGAKWADATYALGKPQGAVQRWFPDGTLGYVMNHENGRPHGAYKRWWADGKPRLDATHVNGQLDGPFKNWLEDGTLYEDAMYRRGVKVSSSRAPK